MYKTIKSQINNDSIKKKPNNNYTDVYSKNVASLKSVFLTKLQSWYKREGKRCCFNRRRLFIVFLFSSVRS